MVNSVEKVIFLGVLLAATSLSAEGRGHISFEVGGGVSMNPAYEGSDDFKIAPFGQGRLEEFSLSNGFKLGGDASKHRTFKIAPTFKMIGKRDASEHDDLEGLDDVDLSIEIGGRATLTWSHFDFYAEMRYGVIGHNGFVGDVGANLRVNPNGQSRLEIGPRVRMADDTYMDEYFSISNAEAENSSLYNKAYDPDPGIKSVGLEARTYYDVTDKWTVIGGVRYDRLIGDAADSPIVENGSEDQFRIRVGLSRKFSFGF